MKRRDAKNPLKRLQRPHRLWVVVDANGWPHYWEIEATKRDTQERFLEDRDHPTLKRKLTWEEAKEQGFRCVPVWLCPEVGKQGIQLPPNFNPVEVIHAG